MRDSAIELLILAALAVIIVLLLGIFFKLDRDRYAPDTSDGIEDARETAETPCPLCNSILHRGEKVHSVLYPGKDERLVEIYGCPYCYPQRSSIERICPVCGRSLAPDDLVYARMFTASAHKPHIHVNGCSICMKRTT